MHLPGKLRRSEGENDIGDSAVDDGHKWAGVTFDFFQKVFSRNSIDNNWMPLVVTVHYDRGFDNTILEWISDGIRRRRWSIKLG